MNLIDTHCHLIFEGLSKNMMGVLASAHQAGLSKIVNVACDPASVRLALEQLALSPLLYAALGIQPHDADQFSLAEGERIKAYALNEPRVVAIGEIGLDAHYGKETLPQQMVCFEYFLNLACELDLPVIIHVRKTHNEVLDLLTTYAKKGLRGVIHCFTGTPQEAQQFLDCGFFISFSGIVTFKNASVVQESARFVPSDRIVIETDSPYLSPEPLRGRPNEPATLAHTCAFVAKLRGQSPEDFAALTTHNALRLFPFQRSV